MEGLHYPLASLPARERGLNGVVARNSKVTSYRSLRGIDTDSRTTILPPNIVPAPVPHNLSPARPKHLHMS